MTLSRRRGQPIIMLGLLMGGWTAVRLVAWSVYPEPVAAVGAHVPGVAAARTATPAHRIAVTGDTPSPMRAEAAAPFALPMAPKPRARRAGAFPLQTALPDAPLPTPAAPLVAPLLAAPMAGPPALPAPAPAPAPAPRPQPALAGGHQLLWMAALSQVPMPPEIAGALAAAPARSGPAASPPAPRRWSGDGWLLLRRGGSGLPAGVFAGSYGASQAGAVLRYRLAPGSGWQPSAYLRASGALGGIDEQEAALGLSARIAPGVPLIAMAEGRVTRSMGRTRLRPAAALVTQIAPIALPAGLRAEVYGQAGYVGGKGATAFVDGQLRIDGRVPILGAAQWRAGIGAWGGAQKGASRLDVGPSASARLGLGESAAARIGVDWRFRVAGRAAPSSGPALTLSAGF